MELLFLVPWNPLETFIALEVPWMEALGGHGPPWNPLDLGALESPLKLIGASWNGAPRNRPWPLDPIEIAMRLGVRGGDYFLKVFRCFSSGITINYFTKTPPF